MKKSDPPDPLLYWIFAFMGAGLLTPWNCVINSFPFFTTLYTSSVNASLPFWMSAAYSYPSVPMLLFMVFFGERLTLRTRIVGPFAAQALIMAALPLVAPTSYLVPLGLMFINGLLTGLLQSSLFGLAAAFPPTYSQAALLGQGLAGAVSSYAQIAVLAAAAASPSSDYTRPAAIAYFSAAALVMAGGAAAYLYLVRLPLAREYLAAFKAHEAEARLHGPDGGGGAEGGVDGGAEDDEDSRALLLSGPGAALAQAPPLSTAFRSAWRVLKRVWPSALGIFLVFVMTFICFPGLMNAIPYRNGLGPGAGPVLGSSGRWAVALLAVFNTFDTIGRFLPGRVMLLRASWLLPASIARFALVPLFVACARGWAPAFGDVFALLLLAVFGVTNGYVASCVFMLTPPLVEDRDQERSGFLLSFFLNTGITVGAQIALAFAT